MEKFEDIFPKPTKSEINMYQNKLNEKIQHFNQISAENEKLSEENKFYKRELDLGTI